MPDDDFLQRAYQYFISKGYAPHQAAALAANAHQESGGNPQAVHDQGTGLGIFGWRDPQPGAGRKTDLLGWAAKNNRDPKDVQTQLDFADYELSQGTEKAAGDKIKAAKDYQEAQAATLGYLRPQGYSAADPVLSHNYVGRYNAGAQLAGVQPIIGSAVAAAGGPGSGETTQSAAYAPPAGLLAGSSDPAALLATQQAAAKAKEEENAYGALTKQGMGLLGQAETPGAPIQAAQAQVHRPQVQPTPMPDFLEILAQQRLKQRGIV